MTANSQGKAVRGLTLVGTPGSGVRAGTGNTAQLLNKVPQVVLLFWIVKMMSTTVGETGADLLSETLGWGLPITTVLVTVLLVIALFAQFRAHSYDPVRYWTVVVLISIAGTLASDMLVDLLGVTLIATTVLFSVLLAGAFIVWWRQERTLSIHTINTRRREAFYWTAILVTFALGTAGGDLLGESLGLGYALSALIFLGAVLLIALLHFAFRLGAVLAFWVAYILTRPLGASLGDLLSQSKQHGGLGLGTIPVSIAFGICIISAVAWFSRTERRRAA